MGHPDLWGVWVEGRDFPCLKVETWGTQICGAEIDFYSVDSWLSMRRCSASRDMELIRFCTLTMPTTRPLSVTGMSERPLAGGDAADGGAERVFGAGHLEGARHD